MPSENRSQLRKRLRHLRRQLTPQQQADAADKLCRQLANSGLLARHRHIAFYMANDGEIDPTPFIQVAHRLGKRSYLPVLAPDNRLWFAHYRPGSPMIHNRFRIPEPASKQRRRTWALDLVLVPLVGFDRSGARLGMGGGFYDRSFAYFNRLPQMRRPQLVGLAHSCQEVEQLSVESWDIPLAMIATENEIIRPASYRSEK